MKYLVYLYYPILLIILLWGAKFCKRKTWNEDYMSLSQTKALQGFFAICIMLHHIAQNTCAYWLPSFAIEHGLECFVSSGYIFVGVFLFCSGYGLYRSYTLKQNYLKGFFGHRILPVLISYYSTSLIFVIVRYFMGEPMDVMQVIFYMTGLQLGNPNGWYVLVMPLMYIGFYLAFKFCKSEKKAVWMICLWVFVYTLIGTMVNHNKWWLCGQWWYNSVHFFAIGIVFARYEKAIIERIKKHYIRNVIMALVGAFLLNILSEGVIQPIVSYYGEDYGMNFIVLRRWICLLSQILASCAFVFFVFMLGLKIKIGNKVLVFMGSITLEFYLIHGVFVELFGFSFNDMMPSLYYIRNIFLLVLVVALPSIPLAMGIQKFDRWLARLLTGKNKKEKKASAQVSE